MKNKKPLIVRLISTIVLYFALVFGGFCLGLIYEQILIVQQAAMVLNMMDTQININFNATEFTKELNNTFIPAWKYAFNETLHNQLNISNKTS